MSNAFDEVAAVASAVTADNSDSLDALLSLLAANFATSPKLSVGANEFSELTPLLASSVNRVSLPELREAVARLRIPFVLATWLYRMHRSMGDTRVERSGRGVEWKHSDVTLYTLKDISARIDLIGLESGRLVVDFSLTPLDAFTGVDIEVGTEVGKTFTPLTDRGEESGHYLLAREINQGPTFQSTVDLGHAPQGTLTIVARVTIGEDVVRLPLRVRFRPAAQLTTVRFQRVYKGRIELRSAPTGFTWRPTNPARRFVGEILFLAFIALRMLKRNGPRTAIQVVGLRLVYWLTRPFLARRKIWITHDKMFSAGDSGEYMYRYMAQNRKVTPYYAVNADSRDIPRLRRERVNVIFPRTVKHVLMYLNADVMLETHSNPASYNRFNGPIGYYLRDLVKFRTYCIQHGLNVHDTHKTMHRTRAGMERMYCAAQTEVKNMVSVRAGYTRDQVVVAGFARLDGQWEPHSNEIMIAPSWRAEYAGASGGISKQRRATKGFEDSAFLNLYKRVVCDPALVRAAHAKGMTIRFVLHPILGSNVAATRKVIAARAEELGIEKDIAESTIVVSAAAVDVSFEEVIKRAAVMVTDYSGVQFDVAYPGKPIVYLFSNELPPQFDMGAMDYEALGFGPMCSTPEETVRELVKLVERDAVIEPQYLDRINDFFEHRDDKNCQRIFEDAYRYTYGRDAS